MFYLLIAASGLLAWLVTIAVERHANSMGLIQAPNARSSHTKPTPRGGGLGIAAGGLTATIAIGVVGGTALWQVAMFTALLAAVGFADDLYNLRAAARMALQLVAFALLVWMLPSLPAIDMAVGFQIGGAILTLLVVLGGVWWLNLFNFMDGIDGIAASQGFLIQVGAALLWVLGTPIATSNPLWWWLLALAAASFGFLLRNWPPAKIFMGDAGSYFLASVIFAAALLTIIAGGLSYASWLALISVFVSDATVTLVKRLLRREPVFEAHKRHAYQILSRRLGSHFKASALFAALTAGWAFPMALAAANLPHLQWLIVLICYLPLLIFVQLAGEERAGELH